MASEFLKCQMAESTRATSKMAPSMGKAVSTNSAGPVSKGCGNGASSLDPINPTVTETTKK